MELKKIKIKEIKLADWNPREITAEELKSLQESIDKFGYVVPILWNEKTGNIIGGHQRFKVLSSKLKPNDLIEVVVVSLDVPQEKALNIALNKIGGKWDELRLANLINDIKKENLDLIDYTGFQEDELRDLEIFGNEYKRPEFTDIIEKFNVVKSGCKKDGNWLYVEYYGKAKEKSFNKILKKLKMKTRHEIDPDFFERLVNGDEI